MLAVVTILAIACGGTAKVKVMGVGLVNVYIYTVGPQGVGFFLIGEKNGMPHISIGIPGNDKVAHLRNQ